MQSLNANQLRQLFPSLLLPLARRYAKPFSDAMAEAGINTPARVAAFVAQLGHESSDLRFMREIWGPSAAQRGYEGRKNLGNTQPGDGRRFMGRGGLQRTGRANYARAQAALNLPLLTQPELLEEPHNAFRSDALFWTDHKLNDVADQLMLRGREDFAVVDRLTKIINGGYNGRDDRRARYLNALRHLPEDLFNEPDTLVQTSAPNEGEATASEPDSQFADLLHNDTVKTKAAAMAPHAWKFALRPVGALYAAWEAHNALAISGSILIGLLLVVFGYLHRKDLVRAGRAGLQIAKKLVVKK